MNIRWILVTALGLLACNTTDDAASKTAGAIDGVKHDPTHVEVKDIDKAFDMEESKPAELKPSSNLTTADINAKSPGHKPGKALVDPKGVNAKSPGGKPVPGGTLASP